MAKTGLGRGLGALIGVNTLASPQPATERGESVRQVKVADITPSPLQPRKNFSEEQLAELVSSIRQRGIIQPLIVRLVGGKYEIIAGERRWRAAKQADLDEVPVIVRQASDHEVLELALIENLQRAELNAMEEAEGYAQLIGDFKLTQEEVSARVGKSRAAIANAVRLLDLAPELHGWIRNGQLSVGHAKVLLSIGVHSEQKLIGERILRDHLTVRQAEKLTLTLQQTAPRRPKKTGTANGPAQPTDANLVDLEKRLQRHAGTRVRIHGNQKEGRIVLEYFNPDDLDRLLRLLGLTDL